MNDWKYLKDEKPEIGSEIIVAEYVKGHPFPDAVSYTVNEESLKKICEDFDERDMWEYIERAKKEEDARDPYGIPNVCFSLIEINDEGWEIAKKQRIERGFDNSELWNLEATILKFTLPRLKVFRDSHRGFPMCFETDDEWKAEIDKMIYWMEKYIEDDWDKQDIEKMKEGKEAFMKYFECLWD